VVAVAGGGSSMNKKSKEINADKLALRLRRLWMGTLYIGIFAVYILLLGLLLVYYGWRPALLSLFLIGVIQLFRYVTNDVDRIGWLLSQENIEGEKEGIIQHRTKLQYLLLTLILLLNLAIVYQVYLVSSWRQAIGLLIGLILVEMMFRLIRATNRQIDYKSPLYGLKHPDPITTGPESSRLEEKLAQLKQMAESGEISQKAYNKTRDRELIKRVMDE
jgi:MFS family permease